MGVRLREARGLMFCGALPRYLKQLGSPERRVLEHSTHIDTEDLGFFKKGEAAEAIRSGATKRNGEIPINPSGGLKSKGHPIGATGIGQVVEVFDQFTGKAGDRTIQDAEIAVTHNFGATGASAAVHVFKKVK